MIKPPAIPVTLLLTLISGIFTVAPAYAEYYTYKDNSGTVVITNRIEDIPAHYRKSYKVIWDKDLESKDSLAKRRAAAQEQQEKQEKQNSDKNLGNSKQPAPQKGKKLVITMDETTGEVIRRFE